MNNKAKHTPGPWKVETLEHGKSSITGEQYYDHIIQPINVLAEQSREKVSANARLIAAAPDLLALLKDVGSWLETNLELGKINAGTANRDGDLVSQIRAAIAKAEGE